LVKALPPRLARRLRFRAELHVPFVAGRTRIGWLRPELAARLTAWPDVFETSAEAVRLLDSGALDRVVEQLAQDGFIPGWRNERYRIADLFDIERAAARPFGLATRAAHVNGIVAGENMWLARRSNMKATDPGMLDNMVGGGVAAGLSIEEVVLKEAWEEAGIPADLARRATRAGIVEVMREVPQGVACEVAHVYDLDLAPDFLPVNQDGEVSEFTLLSFAEVHRLIEETDELAADAALVALDCLNRRSARPWSASAAAGPAT
jgi:8-oxo-dGTP pyrophosphatase MutT (NUDIX family)